MKGWVLGNPRRVGVGCLQRCEKVSQELFGGPVVAFGMSECRKGIKVLSAGSQTVTG